MYKAILVGRLTKDPELKKTTKGTNICSFSVAINRSYTNENDDREADFPSCIAFNKVADNLCSYMRKESLIAIDGRIQIRNYEDTNGERKYVTEVIAEHTQFHESKRSNVNNSAILETNMSPQQNNDSLAGLDITDDELPF